MTKFAAQKLGDFLTVAMRAPRQLRGCSFVVHVETDDGSWCELDADSMDHARTLAHNWVDKMGARGASCRNVLSTGKLHLRPFYTYFATQIETE